MIAAHTLQNVNAEISCPSCPSPVQLHLKDLPLNLRTGATQEPGTLKQIRLEFRQLGVGVTDRDTGVNDDQPVGTPAEDALQFTEDASLDGVSAKERAAWSSPDEETHRDNTQEGKPEMGEDAALRRAKRSGPEFAEFSESGWTGRAGVDADASDERGNPGPLLDGHKLGRSDFRWNRDEGRGHNRQEEPKLTSSTFSLTGDSAHNHAVVYWSGQNSSVSPAQFIIFHPVLIFKLSLSRVPTIFNLHISPWVNKLRDAQTSRAVLTGALWSYRCAPTGTAS